MRKRRPQSAARPLLLTVRIAKLLHMNGGRRASGILMLPSHAGCPRNYFVIYKQIISKEIIPENSQIFYSDFFSFSIIYLLPNSVAEIFFYKNFIKIFIKKKL